MAPATIAFAGSGAITVVHGLAVDDRPDLQVVAVASRQRSHAEERAKQVGALACSYEDLPAGADVVLVASPPALHAAHTLQALAAGAAVVVEKPLAVTLAEADALVAADGADRIAYAENLLFAPVVEQAVALVADLGPLQHLEVRSLQPRPNWGGFLEPSWGGGVLFDLGVHPLALALRILAPARLVQVRAQLERDDDVEVDTYAEVDLELESGLVARVVASWRHEHATWDLQAASATGVVRAELMPTLALERDGEPAAYPAPPAGASVPQIHELGYVEQLAQSVAAFQAGTRPPVDVAFGRDVLEVVCAAYLSAGQGGDPVPLPYPGPRDRTPLELWRGTKL